MNSLFRALIISSIILSVIYWVLPYFDSYWHTDEELQLLAYSGFNSILQTNSIVYWGMLAVGIILNIGLFFYMKLARTLFVPVLAIYSILGVFWGIQVVSPYETVIGGMLNIIDGALIVIVYFTSLSLRFSANDS